MTLWVNRLYPKKKPKRTSAAEAQGKSGDRNIYYTLPVTQNETNTTVLNNQSAQTVENLSVSSVQNRESRVSTEQHNNLEQNASSRVVYQTNVKVDMVNHNQIRGEQDMNRLVQYLRDALEETLASSAEGVM